MKILDREEREGTDKRIKIAQHRKRKAVNSKQYRERQKLNKKHDGSEEDRGRDSNKLKTVQKSNKEKEILDMSAEYNRAGR
jgi:hypothetical protein